ncbi:TraX family protein [Peptoniphilus mikwangii]|uniref:TraX family protein n=1 Tax=Peptoniphilus mikwangii TaxID=1354300 RepID=UPI0004050CBF|nr:TraX family protein [Peptoniphilus mikwangii]
MERNRGFSGSTLKIIAILTMLIDHIGAGIVEKMYPVNSVNLPAMWMNSAGRVDIILRFIGRIAFPLFLFLLIEGYTHTRDKKKYFIRLLIFAFISEIPFDLAFKNKVLEFWGQNIYFELSLIVLMLYLMEYFENNKLLKLSLFLITCVVSTLIRADYGFFGIVAAFILYELRENRKNQVLGIIPAFLFEMPAMTVYLSMIPIYFYNGKRGLKMKYFFYIFYPLHLIIIYLIRINIFKV